MPLRPQRLYYTTIIATCQVNEASLTLDTLQLSRSNVNSVVRSYLSPTPVRVGVGTSLIWAVDQTLSSLRESGYARLKNTRLSTPAQLQFRVPERGSLGTRLVIAMLNVYAHSCLGGVTAWLRTTVQERFYKLPTAQETLYNRSRTSPAVWPLEVIFW